MAHRVICCDCRKVAGTRAKPASTKIYETRPSHIRTAQSFFPTGAPTVSSPATNVFDTRSGGRRSTISLENVRPRVVAADISRAFRSDHCFRRAFGYWDHLAPSSVLVEGGWPVSEHRPEDIPVADFVSLRDAEE